MKQFKTIKLAALAAVLTITLVSAPVFAQNGSDDSTESGSSSSEESSSSGRTKPEDSSQRSEYASQRRAEAKQKAMEELAERKKNVKEKSLEQRKKSCEERKKGIENKFSKIVTNSKRAQTRIDAYYKKAIDYQVKLDVTPTGWETLVATANNASAASQDSITALEAISPTVDCTTNTVPDDIATFKAAAKTTRDSLKAYKSAVKDLLKALKDAKPSTESESEGTQ